MSSRTSFQPPSQWNKTILSSTEQVQSEKVEKIGLWPRRVLHAARCVASVFTDTSQPLVPVWRAGGGALVLPWEVPYQSREKGSAFEKKPHSLKALTVTDQVASAPETGIPKR